MAATPETGFLVVADVTGYPAYRRLATLGEIRAEREAAFGRLAHGVAGALPVIEQREIA